MGMYDNLNIQARLPDGRKPDGPQTKTFDCLLETYTITADGFLTLKGQVIPYHGTIHFCDSDGDPNKKNWRFYQYEAEFHSGRLVEIRRTEPR